MILPGCPVRVRKYLSGSAIIPKPHFGWSLGIFKGLLNKYSNLTDPPLWVYFPCYGESHDIHQSNATYMDGTPIDIHSMVLYKWEDTIPDHIRMGDGYEIIDINNHITILPDSIDQLRRTIYKSIDMMKADRPTFPVFKVHQSFLEKKYL